MAAAARNTYVNEAVERDAFLAEIDGMSAISFTLVTGIMLDSFNGFGSNRAYYGSPLRALLLGILVGGRRY